MVDPFINEREPKLDRLQLVALAGLMFIGAMFVLQRDDGESTSSALPWYDQIWIRQIIWYALGLGAAAAVCVVDYHTLARWSFVIYWATIFCLRRGFDSAHRHDSRLGRAPLD